MRRGIGHHRVVMAEIHGWPALEGKVVKHLCHNPPCVNPDHLVISTQSSNIKDSVHRGTHNTTKLTRRQVVAIRHACRHGMMQTRAAEMFGVTKSTISDIVLGKTWRHLP